MEFKIGDRVMAKAYESIPEKHQSKGVARLSGKVGTVIDKLHSEINGGFIYRVHLDGYDRPSNKMFTEEQLHILIKKSKELKFEFEYIDNVVVAKLYEMGEESKTEIARGHGHIIHDGTLGIAQAASYALKKLYEKMNGGTV